MLGSKTLAALIVVCVCNASFAQDVSLGSLTDAFATLRGDEGDHELGFSISGGGRINDNTDWDEDTDIPDFIIGIPFWDPSDDENRWGKALVYDGAAVVANSAMCAACLLCDLTDPNGTTDNDWFGIDVAEVGDVNNDGHNEIAVGMTPQGSTLGRVYVFSGEDCVGGNDAVELLLTFIGEQNADAFGYYIANAGNANGDTEFSGKGVADLAVTSFIYDESGKADAGRAYIIYLDKVNDALPAEYDLSLGELDEGPDDDYVVLKFASGDQHESDAFGRDIDGIGDVNANGRDDVIVGAPADNNTTVSGRAAIFDGGGTIFMTIADPDDPGSDDGEFGFRVGGIGDAVCYQESNGIEDVIISDHRYDVGTNSNEGAVYLYAIGLSGSTYGLVDYNGDMGTGFYRRYEGENPNDLFGRGSVYKVGSLDGNAFYDWGASAIGGKYIFYFLMPPADDDDDNGVIDGDVIRSTAAIAIDEDESPASQFGGRLAYVEDLDTDGTDDLLTGFQEYDYYAGGVTWVYDTGKAWLYLSGDAGFDELSHSGFTCGGAGPGGQGSGDGDVNRDGTINQLDLLALNEFIRCGDIAGDVLDDGTADFWDFIAFVNGLAYPPEE